MEAAVLQSDGEFDIKRLGDGFYYIAKKKSLIPCKCVVEKMVFKISYTEKGETHDCELNICDAIIRSIDKPMGNKYGMTIKIQPDSKKPAIVNADLLESHDVYWSDHTLRDAWASFTARKIFPSLGIFKTNHKFYSGQSFLQPFFIQVPRIDSVPLIQHKATLYRKLRQCAVRFDPLDEENYSAELQLSFSALEEIIASIDILPALYQSLLCINDCLQVIGLSIFRSLPVQQIVKYNAMDEEIPFLDPEWDYLQMMYTLLLRVITVAPLPIVGSVISSSFHKKLVHNLLSADLRERDFVKSVVHRLYGRLPGSRASLRNEFCYFLLSCPRETEHPYGVNEVLEIYASVISGFAMPLKAEHVQALNRVLLPLHKSVHYEVFYEGMIKCMRLFLYKDSSLSSTIFPYLCKHWPFGSSVKEQVYLYELEELLCCVSASDIECIRDVLFERIRLCLMSEQFQIAEKCGKMWENEKIRCTLVDHAETRAIILSHVSTVLNENCNSYWCSSVRKISKRILQLYEIGDFFPNI